MTNIVSGKRRYLALFFPFLPAERWLRTAPRPPDAPLIFAEKQRGAMRLASVDAAAAPTAPAINCLRSTVPITKEFLCDRQPGVEGRDELIDGVFCRVKHQARANDIAIKAAFADEHALSFCLFKHL